MSDLRAFFTEPTRKQWLSFLAAWLGWILDAFDFTIFTLVLTDIVREFGVSRTAASVSLSLTLLVRFAGGVTAGWMADRFGRKLPLMLSLLWLAVFDTAVAFAPSFTWVLVLRTLFGFGMGAEWAAGAALAMENWPKRTRGIASGLLQGGWAIGFFLAAAASAVVVPLWGWRALFLFAAAPALLILPIRYLVPESEEFLAGRARPGEAPVAATNLRVWWTRLGWASVVMSAAFTVYYALIALYPTMLETERGLGKPQVATYVQLFNVGMVIGTLITGTLASRFGARRALAVPALLMLAALPLFVGWVPGALAVGAVLGGLLGAGMAGVTPVWLSELFPAPVRGRSMAIVYQVGGSVASLAPPVVSLLAEGRSLALAIAIVAGAAEVVLLTLLFFRRGVT